MISSASVRKIAAIFICCSPLVVFFVNCDGGAFHPLKLNQPAATSETSTQPPETLVNAIVVQGHMGRTLMSCDDGQSWIHDRSDDDDARCWVKGDPHYVECDHHAGAGRGLDYGDGNFFANFGHGAPGTIRRSADGYIWTVVKNLPLSAGAVLYALNRLILFFGQFSLDQGATWQASAPPPDLDFANAKKVGTDIYVFGRTKGLAISRDGGDTWFTPPHFSTRVGHGA